MVPVPCSGFVFFLGREVPREQLLVVIRSFGGQIGWAGDESPFLEHSNQITHQVRLFPQAPLSFNLGLATTEVFPGPGLGMTVHCACQQDMILSSHPMLNYFVFSAEQWLPVHKDIAILIVSSHE